MKLTDHFSSEEFACKCGCGKVAMDAKFMEMLELARTVAGVPFEITSGFRCAKHPQNSRNHVGFAADIACADDRLRWKILYALIMAGFKRIGVNKVFLHADITPGAANAVWFY